MKMRTSRCALLPVVFACLLVSTARAQSFDESKWGKNSPGVELNASEEPRQPTPSATVLTYTLSGKGFPPDLSYSLWGWIPGHKPQKAIEGVMFDAKGVLVCNPKSTNCKGETPGAAIKIKTTAVLAEPKRFAVVSDDGRVAAFISVVPFPIEATDKNCKVEIVRESPQAEIVLVRASGFVPYEMLNITGHVGGMDSVHSPTVGPDGTWQAMIGTKAPGEERGTASLQVTGQACSVSLSFNWGEGTTKEQ